MLSEELANRSILLKTFPVRVNEFVPGSLPICEELWAAWMLYNSCGLNALPELGLKLDSGRSAVSLHLGLLQVRCL